MTAASLEITTSSLEQPLILLLQQDVTCDETMGPIRNMITRGQASGEGRLSGPVLLLLG